MTEFKMVVGDPKTGKTVQKVIAEDNSAHLMGLKIGDTVKGDKIGFSGYEFKITGGSDDCGFPMRRDVSGNLRKKIFAVEGVGLSKKDKGIRVRKRVAPNLVHEKTSQINVTVSKAGKENIFEAPVAEPAESKANEEKKE